MTNENKVLNVLAKLKDPVLTSAQYVYGKIRKLVNITYDDFEILFKRYKQSIQDNTPVDTANQSLVDSLFSGKTNSELSVSIPPGEVHKIIFELYKDFVLTTLRESPKVSVTLDKLTGYYRANDDQQGLARVSKLRSICKKLASNNLSRERVTQKSVIGMIDAVMRSHGEVYPLHSSDMFRLAVGAKKYLAPIDDTVNSQLQEQGITRYNPDTVQLNKCFDEIINDLVETLRPLQHFKRYGCFQDYCELFHDDSFEIIRLILQVYFPTFFDDATAKSIKKRHQRYTKS